MTDLAQAAALHRQAAALATAADRAGVASDELPTVRARLLAQQDRFAEVAARDGVPLPALVPTPGEVSIATPALGDLSPTSVAHAVRAMLSTLEAAEAALGVPALVGGGPPAEAPPTPPAPAQAPASPPVGGGVWVRNGLIYLGFAASVTVAQFFLFLAFDETTLPRLAPLCLVVLPAFSWFAGWLTIGLAFPAGPGEQVARTPKLGAIINLGPIALLFVLVGILFLAR